MTSRADLERLLRFPAVIQAELEGFTPGGWQRRRRPKQIPPEQGRIWLIHTGRGWGKTRTASEFVADGVANGESDMLAIGPTAGDVADIMAPMLMKVLAARGYKPQWVRSEVAPSILAGRSKIHLRSGQRIDRCRGLGVSRVWADEIDSWKPELMTPRDGWLSVVEPTCRVAPARFVVSSTPKRGGMVAWLSTRADVVVTTGHSRENAENLADGFVPGMAAAFAGSWLARQELAGEIVADIEGALVTQALIDQHRVAEAPELVRIAVGVDPSGGTEAQGIVAAGRSATGHVYVLADRTCNLAPDGWGRRVVECFDALDADRLVVERNFGGDMVESTLRTVRRELPIRMVTASRGKHVRFEPVAALYEQGRLHHVGAFPELEDEVTAFTADGYEAQGSPNRADALVWAVTELVGTRGVSPADLYSAAAPA